MSVIEEIEGYVSSKVKGIKTLFLMISLEAKLARLSIFPLIINVCMLFVVLITLWSSLMLLIGYFTILTFNNYFMAIGIIVLLNLALLFGLLKYLTYNLSNMSFEKTREYFSERERNEQNKLEKTANCSDSNSGEQVTLSTKSRDKA